MQGVKQLLVSTKTKFDDVLFTYKDADGNDTNFYKIPERNVNWDVSVTGTAEADYPRLRIKKGDDIAFSYMVIAEKKWYDADSLFQLSIHTEGIFSEWTDGSGGFIRKIKSPFSAKHKSWNAFYMKNEELISQMVGNDEECERWLSQFNFSNNNGRHIHLFEVGGKDMWRVEHSMIIAKKSGHKISMFHDKILAKRIYSDMTTQVELSEGIILPKNSIQIEYKNMAMIEGDYPKLGLKKGDIVGFQDEYAQKYKLWGIDYLILIENRIFGKYE